MPLDKHIVHVLMIVDQCGTALLWRVDSNSSYWLTQTVLAGDWLTNTCIDTKHNMKPR